jgi:hypothetical protein
MNAAFIYMDDKYGTRFWNRRKKAFQDHLTKSCVYPTFKGAERMSIKLFNSYLTDHFRPLNDTLGAHDLADFAAKGNRM